MGTLLKDPVALVLLSVLLLFLLFIGILSFVRFRRDLQAVRMEMSRAHTPLLATRAALPASHAAPLCGRGPCPSAVCFLSPPRLTNKKQGLL
mgnify:CR=1 FL=1